MRTRTAELLVLLTVGAPLVLSAASAAERSPDTWTAWYSLSARVRGARGAADLEAGGRLSMTGRRDADGTLELTLGAVIEEPWKLYWVDPRGPFGEEVKVAYVVTLAEGTWTALDAARAASADDGLRRHRRWLENAEHPRPLDGTFAFIVVGAARGRFGITIAPDGAVSAVSNRMTDRWLNGPFDQFVGSWGISDADATGDTGVAAAGPAPEGYWFWNHGETRPFEYEPHTYHALAAALDLLALPPPAPNEEREAIEPAGPWRDLVARTARVLEILAPRAGSGAASSRFMRELATLGVKREVLPAGGTRVQVESRPKVTGPDVARETVFSSQGLPVADRIRVRLSRGGGSSLEVEVGYEPNHQERESR